MVVPGASSSPGLPAMVTNPRLVGCLNWRWLPRVRSRYQPSASINLIAYRTFTFEKRRQVAALRKGAWLPRSFYAPTPKAFASPRFAQSVISVNGADGIRDVEGKAARVAASSRGKLASFKSVVTSYTPEPQAAPACIGERTLTEDSEGNKVGVGFCNLFVIFVSFCSDLRLSKRQRSLSCQFV